MRSLTAVVLLLGFSVGSALAATPAQRCERGVAAAVASCVGKVNARARRCYADTGAACPAADAAVGKAVAKLEATIGKRCPDAASAQAAGFGALVTPSAVVDRARESCLGQAATIAARTFGGPQAALLAGASADVRSCLDTAFEESAKLLGSSYRIQRSCIRKAHAGRVCDPTDATGRIATLEGKATTRV